MFYIIFILIKIGIFFVGIFFGTIFDIHLTYY